MGVGCLVGWVGWMDRWVEWIDGLDVLILKIELDQAIHMLRAATNVACEIQSAPNWSDHFRGIVVIGCLKNGKIQYTVLCFWLQ